MKMLVTGGLGFLGAPLVGRLVRAGHAVRVLDDASRGRADKLGDVASSVEVVSADIRDGDAVRRATAGCDTVFHLAYVNGTRFFYERPKHVLDVGVRGMLNVLDAAVAENIAQLFVASSSEVYQTPPAVPTDEAVPLSIPDVGNPRYSYGGGKILCELMTLNWAREHFERAVIFRPHNVYGPDMGWEHVIPQFAVRMTRLRTEAESTPPVTVKFPIQGNGSETRAFCHVDDFTDGLMVLLDKGAHRHVYHIGTREEVSIADLARRVARVLHVDVDLQAGPLAAGGTPRRCPEIAKLEALGYAPRVTLDAGLESTVEWYSANVHKAPT